MRSKYRLGVDAGGTFTDFVLADAGGGMRLFKTPSTPQDPTAAIANGLALMSEELGEPIRDIVANCDLCINGTTVALNALLQHKGVKVGLICTAGHEDSQEIRLGHKEDGYRYDHNYPPATQLVPRYLRRGIRERIISNGTVRTPLSEQDVRDAVELFKKEGVVAVAVSFVWSVLDNSHERRAAEIVREMAPDMFVSIGSEIYPQVREYTRTSTTILNAYLGPILRTYVDSVDRYFRSMGAKYPVRYYQSNGGLGLGSAVSGRAVYAINSGPASAPRAGLFVTEPWGDQNVITVDMGGTSFDITLTKDGRTNISKGIDFQRYRLGVPMIQVETLGAGGGSIGWIDSLGLLQVGPQSAGADPGPACYGTGGTEPTVTDANVVLGYVNQEALLGGRMPIHRDKAFEAIKTHIADPLGISVERAAYGIFTIVNNNMVNGIRRVSVERGYDPRDFVLVVGGGASSAHICSLADTMGIAKVVIPKLASVLCAYGQVISDVKYNYMAGHPARLDSDEPLARIHDLYGKIEETGIADLKDDGFEDDQIVISRSADMRYVGQVHECTVELGDMEFNKENLPAIIDAFHRRHEELFTYSERQSTVELVNIESTISGRVEKPRLATIPAGGNVDAAVTMRRPMIFSADGTTIEAPVYDGAKLGAGDVVAGPCVVEEETTTIVVEPGWQASLHESGSYVLARAV
ncbi:hydantoinase/oxoprolinase family protein [Microbaculum marinum]|uniref:Hydantoinase/oxoprolinase family protein n=1 Tax=Microbaculum marinum TaxID=1764581 RepID=A0AAW9RR44_9HYPH